MRFLCLHGRGTCAKAFEMQTSSIRDELIDHEFVFVNGTVPTKPSNEHVARVIDEHYGYIREGPNVDQCQELVSTMIHFVRTKGPFDGVLGFSEGGMVAAMLLIEDARRPFVGFKCGIFFSTAPPFDPDVRYNGSIRCVGMDPAVDGTLLHIPTAHIRESSPSPWLWRHSPLAALWESHHMGDTGRLNDAMIGLCEGSVRELFTHHGVGHDIPGVKSPTELAGVLRAIERTIERCRDA